MTYAAKILADSLSPDGVRLTTFEVTFPRIVLAEFNTHREFSRNSASSRAIPVKKMIKMVEENPYTPEVWGTNQKGMQAGEPLTGLAAEQAKGQWLAARDDAVKHAKLLLGHGIHKQLTNRLLEPWMWHTVIFTSTPLGLFNFFHLRDNPLAHPGIATPARMCRELYEEASPRELGADEWHMPLIFPEDIEACDGDQDKLIKVSVGRCARVSYLTHDGKRDLEADIELHDRLLKAGHMSPFEHVARPISPLDVDIVWRRVGEEPLGLTSTLRCGNLTGWVQYRKTIPGEHDIIAYQEEQLAKKHGRPF